MPGGDPPEDDHRLSLTVDMAPRHPGTDPPGGGRGLPGLVLVVPEGQPDHRGPHRAIAVDPQPVAGPPRRGGSVDPAGAVLPQVDGQLQLPEGVLRRRLGPQAAQRGEVDGDRLLAGGALLRVQHLLGRAGEALVVRVHRVPAPVLGPVGAEAEAGQVGHHQGRPNDRWRLGEGHPALGHRAVDHHLLEIGEAVREAAGELLHVRRRSARRLGAELSAEGDHGQGRVAFDQRAQRDAGIVRALLVVHGAQVVVLVLEGVDQLVDQDPGFLAAGGPALGQGGHHVVPDDHRLVVRIVVADHLLPQHRLEELADVGVLREEAERLVDLRRLQEIVVLHLLGERLGDGGRVPDGGHHRPQEGQSAHLHRGSLEAGHHLLLVRGEGALGGFGDRRLGRRRGDDRGRLLRGRGGLDDAAGQEDQRGERAERTLRRGRPALHRSTSRASATTSGFRRSVRQKKRRITRRARSSAASSDSSS